LRYVRARQGWMIVLAPRVQAEQDGSIRIQNLTKVVMSRSRLRLAKSDWYHLKLAGTSLTPMIVHVRFIAIVCHGFTRIRMQSVQIRGKTRNHSRTERLKDVREGPVALRDAATRR
jgi:hypothetical protein